MRNVCKAVPFCLLAIAMAGCGSPEAVVDIDAAVSKAVKAQTAPLLTRNQELEARVAQLERTNLRLDRTIEAMKDSSTTNQVRDMVKGFLEEEVQTLVVTKLDEKIGGAQEAGQMFTGIWDQQMAAYEARKEAESEARREERREEEEVRREERNADRLARLQEDLNLNDDQAERLSIAQGTFRSSLQETFLAMREGGDFDRDTIRDKMAGLREVHNEIVGQFLSEEQMEAYAEKNQSPWSFFGGGGGGDRGRGRGGPGGGPGGGR